MEEDSIYEIFEAVPRILVVGEKPKKNSRITKRLAGKGYHAKAAENEKGAMKEIRAGLPHLILLDERMGLGRCKSLSRKILKMYGRLPPIHLMTECNNMERLASRISSEDCFSGVVSSLDKKVEHIDEILGMHAAILRKEKVSMLEELSNKTQYGIITMVMNPLRLYLEPNEFETRFIAREYWKNRESGMAVLEDIADTFEEVFWSSAKANGLEKIRMESRFQLWKYYLDSCPAIVMSKIRGQHPKYYSYLAKMHKVMKSWPADEDLKSAVDWLNRRYDNEIVYRLGNAMADEYTMSIRNAPDSKSAVSFIQSRVKSHRKAVQVIADRIALMEAAEKKWKHRSSRTRGAFYTKQIEEIGASKKDYFGMTIVSPNEEALKNLDEKLVREAFSKIGMYQVKRKDNRGDNEEDKRKGYIKYTGFVMDTMPVEILLRTMYRLIIIEGVSENNRDLYIDERNRLDREILRRSDYLQKKASFLQE